MSSPHPFNLSSKLDFKNSSLKNLLIGLFNAFIFNIITDILVFITDILLCVFYMFYLLFVLLLCKYAFCVKYIFYSVPVVGINNIWTIVNKVMSLLFNMLSRFIIAFLPRSKCLLISRLQSPSTVTLEPKKIKYVTSSTFCVFCFTISLFLFAVKWWERCHDHIFLNVEFKPVFSLFSFTLLKRFFSSSQFLP